MRISDWSSDVCSSDLVAKGEDRAGADVGEDDAQRPQRQRQPRAARLGGVMIGGDARNGASPAFGNRLLEFDWLAWKRQPRSEEHTSELQSLMRTSYAVFCLKKKNTTRKHTRTTPLPTYSTHKP